MKKFLYGIIAIALLLVPIKQVSAKYDKERCLSCETYSTRSDRNRCIEKYCDPDKNWLEKSNTGTGVGREDVLNKSTNTNITFCSDTAPIWRFAGRIFLVLKILVPALIIILGVMDLAKAVTSNDDKAINKATNSIVKRVIIGMAIFFIPTIISFLFSLIKEAAPFLNSAEECQVCLLRANSSECESYVNSSNTSREER